MASTTATADPTTAQGVAVTGLVKSFGSVRAVRGVDFKIGAGETVALLGPNGAGKSTTIDMILGLRRPDRGRIAVFGRSPEAAVKAGLVGGMLQVGDLIRDLEVRELLAMMASVYPRPLAVDDVLAKVGLEDIANRRTQKLSGGQTQRVRLGLALISNPELLVLDEPTVALDVESRREFWSTMHEVAALGKTILFATHYLEEADAYSDRIVLIARGRVVADGPATEIKAKVGQRTIRTTLPDVGDTALQAIPGVTGVERRGEAVVLRCGDSDAALRRLLLDYPGARDIEVRGAALEDAFIELTTEQDEEEEGEER